MHAILAAAHGERIQILLQRRSGLDTTFPPPLISKSQWHFKTSKAENETIILKFKTLQIVFNQTDSTYKSRMWVQSLANELAVVSDCLNVYKLEAMKQLKRQEIKLDHPQKESKEY